MTPVPLHLWHFIQVTLRQERVPVSPRAQVLLNRQEEATEVFRGERHPPGPAGSANIIRVEIDRKIREAVGSAPAERQTIVIRKVLLTVMSASLVMFPANSASIVLAHYLIGAGEGKAFTTFLVFVLVPFFCWMAAGFWADATITKVIESPHRRSKRFIVSFQ